MVTLIKSANKANEFIPHKWISILIMNLLLFFLFYLIRFHFVMNGDDWFLAWVGLEINIIIFIALIYDYNKVLRVESCLKYFFVQRLGSACFLRIFYSNRRFLDVIICLLLRYKIGAGPFFFWFPSVCSGISWFCCFLLITLQKVIPLILMRIFVSWIIYFLVTVRLIFGVLGSFNQVDLKQLVAYSSVYHLGWILLCNLSGDGNWFNYLVLYSFIVLPVVIFLGWVKIINILDLIKIKFKGWFIILILRISGIPPFLGFFLKWYAFVIIFDYDFFFFVFLFLCSVIIFYVYFRIIYDVLISSWDEIIWGNVYIIRKGRSYIDILRGVGLMRGLLCCLFILF